MAIIPDLTFGSTHDNITLPTDRGSSRHGSQDSNPIQQLTAAQFEAMFADENACCAYLVGRRWPTGVRCPRCGAEKPAELKGNPWHWQCYNCAPQTSYRFSHIAGTIFENTNKPLRDWFKVAHLMLTSKKGMSALQIKRYMGFGSYKTAWLMCHKIRARSDRARKTKLGGIVEVDETYVGGKDKNRHWDKRRHNQGRGVGKEVVIGAVKRKGNVVARVVENVKRDTVGGLRTRSRLQCVSLLCTDQWVGSYSLLRYRYQAIGIVITLKASTLSMM